LEGSDADLERSPSTGKVDSKQNACSVRDPFYEESLINHCSKIEFFGRLASAADACLLEQPDVTAHLVCAAVLREAYAMAKQIDKGEFDFLVGSKGNQVGEERTLPEDAPDMRASKRLSSYGSLFWIQII
jgi:hypothetical protein